MSKINPNASALINDYIERKAHFKPLSKLLRSLIHKAYPQVVEDWKWSSPVFQKNGMVCGFVVFKNHVSLSFFNGAKISDKHQLFSKDCTAQHSKTIKFTKDTQINENQVFDYIKEAFLITKANIKKATVKKEIVIPALLKTALKENPLAAKNFNNLAYTYRKEYAMYITEAKREATQLKRLTSTIENLAKNIKLNEQYKC